MRVVALCVLLMPSLLWAATDRRALVEAVHARVGFWVAYALNQPEADQLSDHDRAILHEIREEIAEHVSPLKFETDHLDFFFEPGQPIRLMGTAELQGSPIAVNVPLMNDPSVELDAPTLVKLFVHEYGRHVLSEADLAQFDRLGQFVEDQLRPYERTVAVDGGTMHLLSVPVDRMEQDLSQAALFEPQRTFLIQLEEESGAYFDLTDELEKQLPSATSKLNSLISDANAVGFAVARAAMMPASPLIQKMTVQVSRQAVEQGFSPDIAQEFISGFRGLMERFLDIRQIRVLELMDSASSQSLPTETQITLKALYTATRVDRSEFRLTEQDMKWVDFLASPLLIHLRWSFAQHKLLGLHAELRPDVDYSKVANMRGINRTGGTWQALRVRVDGPVKTAHLQLRHANGDFFIAASSMETLPSGQVNLTFESPQDLVRIPGTVNAESVLIDHESSHLLDRQMVVQENPTPAPSETEAVESLVVPGTLGLWGQVEGMEIFRTEFNPDTAAVLLDRAPRGKPMLQLSADHIKLEFQTLKPLAIRALRLRLRSYRFNVKPDAELRVKNYKIDGVERPIAVDGGDISNMKEVYETIPIPLDQIHQSSADGQHHVLADFKMLTKLVPMDGGTVAHAPPYFLPLSLDVVLDDFSVVSIPFKVDSVGDICAQFLKP